MQQKSIESRAVSASKWSFLSQITQILAPLTLIILVSLLTPEDFGLVAIATLVVSFAKIFWDIGFSKALIQIEENSEKAANVIFWINSGLGFVIYVLVFLVAGFIADFFKDPRLQPVIQVQGCLIILNSISSVQITLFQRELNFKPIFLTQLLSSSIPNLVAIVLAFIGYGYWALVLGSLVGALAQLIVLWKISNWRPKVEFDLKVAKELLSFGLWVTTEFFLVWLIMSLDELFLSVYLGIQVLGLYRTGKTLISMIFMAIFGSLTPVMFSAFSRMQNSVKQLRNALVKATKFHALLTLPMGVGLFLVAESISKLLFRDQWLGIDKVIGILGLTYSLFYLVNANPSAYRAIRKINLQIKIILFLLFYSIPAFWIAIQYGLEVFLWIQFSVQLVALPIHLYYTSKYFKVNPYILLNNLKFILIALVAMTISMLFISSLMSTTYSWLNLIISMTTGSIVFFLFLLPERKFIQDIIYIILKS